MYFTINIIVPINILNITSNFLYIWLSLKPFAF